MTTGLSYNGLVAGTTSYPTQIAELTVVAVDDPNFEAILPQAITYAENRIYRDLDLLSTVKRSSSYTLTAGNRNLEVPAADFVTIQEINVILPAGTSVADNGTRSPLLPTTKEFLNTVYSSVANSAAPQYFAMIDQSNMIVGPWPNNTYSVEITGTFRPASLGNGTNGTVNTTFVSLYLPDIFIMATMIYVSGYQRNFGRQSDDPQMAQSYESQYQTLLGGAMIEEARKKFQAAAWTSMSPARIASPTRG